MLKNFLGGFVTRSTANAVARCTTLAATLATIALCAPSPVAAQSAPRVSALFGLGNSFGWVGGQLEGYVAGGRVSGFLGVGYMPNLMNDEGSGMAGAAGLRAYTSGTRHRGMLEVSISALSTTVQTTFGSDVVEKSQGYGPGVAIGYQFIGESGFTFLVSGGAGLDDQVLDPEGSRVRPIIGVGLGISAR